MANATAHRRCIYKTVREETACSSVCCKLSETAASVTPCTQLHQWPRDLTATGKGMRLARKRSTIPGLEERSEPQVPFATPSVSWSSGRAQWLHERVPTLKPSWPPGVSNSQATHSCLGINSRLMLTDTHLSLQFLPLKIKNSQICLNSHI